MSPGVLLLFALSVACDPAAPTVPAGHTRFVGRIFDGGETFEGAVEIDESGVIVAVDREPRSGVEGEVEIGDGTLLPGLIDLHTHLTASGGTIQTVPVDDHEPNLKACLRNGVTSTLHLGGLARVGFEIRRRERDSEILSPRIFSAGPFLDPPGGSHCASGVQQLDHCVSLPSPEAATTAVRNLARIYAPDVIKITNDSGIPERPSNAFDGATLRALVAAAGPRPVVAHIRNVRDIESAVAAGVGTITHLPFDERFSRDDAAPWVAAGTRFIPTIRISQLEQELVTGALDLDDPTLVHDVPRAVLDELRAFEPPDTAAIARVAEVRENVRHNFRSLTAARAVILAGSDAGIFAGIHGRMLVDELEEMTLEGVANHVALAAATSEAAEFLGRPDLGRIGVGATADLLIVEGDPLSNITALRDVRSVYLGGVEIDRESLEVDRGVPLERDPARGIAADEVCLRTTECDPSQTCTRLYRCADRCETSSDCAAGTFCAADIADARGCYPDLGCDPIAQDCNNGTACVPIANGATWCVSAGAARAGEPCSDASLAALCEPGTRCNAGTCEQLCAVGGVGCAGGLGCVSLEPETGVDVGVCR